MLVYIRKISIPVGTGMDTCAGRFCFENMKKIVSILVILYMHYAAMAQVADTTAYLRDSIVGKKSYYMGKPLKVLLLDLKIKPTFDHTFVFYVPAKEKDTTNLARIDFQFCNPIEMIKYPNLNLCLLVRFTPVRIPCLLFKAGCVLGCLDPWTNQKQTYYMQDTMVVTDIQLY
jgi:hypothetical protein